MISTYLKPISWRRSRHTSKSTAGLALVVAAVQIACVRWASYSDCRSFSFRRGGLIMSSRAISKDAAPGGGGEDEAPLRLLLLGMEGRLPFCWLL